MSTTRKNYQRESLIWEETRDPEYPYSAKVNQDSYLIRLNDFPDESLYTLIVNNEEVEDLEDWPERWIISSDAQDTKVEQAEKVRSEIPREQKQVLVSSPTGISALSERDRDVMYRYYIAEEDSEQICADLGLTKAALRNILFRASKRIREMLSRHS
jgi:DNA-directed RNA polymerase specialized sigma subunit